LHRTLLSPVVTSAAVQKRPFGARGLSIFRDARVLVENKWPGLEPEPDDDFDPMVRPSE